MVPLTSITLSNRDHFLDLAAQYPQRARSQSLLAPQP